MNLLRQKIEQEIRERGPIPFSRYMELCLYDPDLGYYSRKAEQFGKAGDFYTSSDVHKIFGRLLARQFEEMWRALGSPEQIETGRTRPGPRPLRARCSRLVRKEVSGFLQRTTLRPRRKLADVARTNRSTLAHHFESGRAEFAAVDLAKIGRIQPQSGARMQPTA